MALRSSVLLCETRWNNYDTEFHKEVQGHAKLEIQSALTLFLK